MLVALHDRVCTHYIRKEKKRSMQDPDNIENVVAAINCSMLPLKELNNCCSESPSNSDSISPSCSKGYMLGHSNSL